MNNHNNLENDETLKKLAPNGFVPISKNFGKILTDYYKYETIEKFIEFFNTDEGVRQGFIDITFFTKKLKEHKPASIENVKMELLSKDEDNKSCSFVIITDKEKVYEEINFITGFTNISIEENKEAYSRLLNAKGTNALSKIPTSPKAIKSKFVYHPEMDANSLFTDDDVKVTVKELDNSTQLGNSILFFYYLLCSFTRNVSYKQKNLTKEDYEIYFDVEAYLTARGKEINTNNKKNLMREVKQYYETLKRITLDFEEYDYNKKELKKNNLEIFAGKGSTESFIKRSKNYFFILNPFLAEYLIEKNFISYFPNNAFNIDIMRHPNALSITNKLSVLYSMNYWKSNKGLVSLKNLLSSISDIPSYEDVSKSNRAYFNRIIEPLEKDLDYLQELNILTKWEWANKKREVLTNEQLKSYDYKALENCFLSYELADYPEQEQEEFKERKAKKQANKKKTTKKRCKGN